MPAKQYRVSLNDEERSYLEQLVNTGVNKARKITRARILLLADEGSKCDLIKIDNETYNKYSKIDKEIITSLGVSVSTVAKTRLRYAEEGLERALNDKPRPGRPPKFTGRDEALLTAIACSDPPEGYGRWTIRLLADRLVELGVVEDISRETVRRSLKKGVSSHGSGRNGA